MSTDQTAREQALQELSDLGQDQGACTPAEAVAAIAAVRAEHRDLGPGYTHHTEGCGCGAGEAEPTQALRDLMSGPPLANSPEHVIASTLGSFGMRLPHSHDRAGIDERIELMRLVAGHVVKALRDAGYPL